MSDKVLHPFGAADKLLVAFLAMMSVAICNNKSIVEVDTMTGDGTLDIDIDAETRDGAEILLLATADGTPRNLTLGAGTTGEVIAIAAGETVAIKLEYDGVQFVAINQ